MSNRRWSLVLLFLTMAGGGRNLSAQAVALQVQVYDYTGMSPAALLEFATGVQRILARPGIPVKVDVCARGVSTPCEAQTGSSSHVFIRVFSRNQKARRALGESVVDRGGGTCASVFLRAVQEEAAGANVPALVVLAYAAAHEVGHLLLGDEAHTPHGLMKAHWADDDYRAMAQGRIQFSREQIRELKQHYGGGDSAAINAMLRLPHGVRATVLTSRQESLAARRASH